MNVKEKTTILQLKNVSFRYPSAEENEYVFKNINLSIEKEQILQIIGRNGSGKTTLLKIICGILNPTEGQIIRFNNAIDFVYLDQNVNNFLSGQLTVNEQIISIFLSSGPFSPISDKTVAKTSMISPINQLRVESAVFPL